MSEAASVPFSETKAPESADRLNRGALGLVDISASTMANIGPAYSFYFGFGFLVFTAGVAAPLTIVVVRSSRSRCSATRWPSSPGCCRRRAGSSRSWASRSDRAAGGHGAAVRVGYMIAVSSVLAVSGGFLSITVEKYFDWNVPWGIFSVLSPPVPSS